MSIDHVFSTMDGDAGKRGADYPHHASLAICAGPSVRLWNTLEDDPHEFPCNNGAPTNTKCAPSGARGADREIREEADSQGILTSAVAWNRNNKVVAVGLENGQVQIRYASGTYMSTLKGPDGQEQYGRSVSDLSWSTGSKTLAVGSVGGHVRVHDMTTKTCTSTKIYDSSLDQRSIGVRHHPDDAFVAVGGREKIALYSLKMEHVRGECICSASAVVKNNACFPSVSVGTGKPYIAAGSDKNGIVAVWDYTTETELACDKFRHAHKGPCKVALAPLEPFLLYSVGMDGLLKMQDLRSQASIASPTAIASVSSTMGVSSLSIHEHSGDVAVGTSDGNVFIFNAGLVSRKAKQSMYFGSKDKDGSDLDCPILDLDWQHSFHHVSLHAREHVAAIESHTIRSARERLHASEINEEPLRVIHAPRDIHCSAISTEPPPRQHVQSGDLQMVSTPLDRHKSSPTSSSTITSGGHRAGDNGEHGDRVSEPWRIRAAQQQRRDSGATSSANTPVSSMRTPMSLKQRKEKIPPVPCTDKRNSDQNASLENTDVSQLILALHLDMVTMFEQQDKATKDMFKHIMDRQDELQREVHELKEVLNDVLTRRSETSWM